MRLINDCHEAPNLQLMYWPELDVTRRVLPRRAFLVAKHDIPASVELTWDYGRHYERHWLRAGTGSGFTQSMPTGSLGEEDEEESGDELEIGATLQIASIATAAEAAPPPPPQQQSSPRQLPAAATRQPQQRTSQNRKPSAAAVPFSGPNPNNVIEAAAAGALALETG